MGLLMGLLVGLPATQSPLAGFCPPAAERSIQVLNRVFCAQARSTSFPLVAQNHQKTQRDPVPGLGLDQCRRPGVRSSLTSVSIFARLLPVSSSNSTPIPDGIPELPSVVLTTRPVVSIPPPLPGKLK